MTNFMFEPTNLITFYLSFMLRRIISFYFRNLSQDHVYLKITVDIISQ